MKNGARPRPLLRFSFLIAINLENWIEKCNFMGRNWVEKCIKNI